MRFVSGTGYLMTFTRICENLEAVCAGNTVPHLLYRITVRRTLRDHQLLDLVFNTILLEDLLYELDVNFSVLENMMADAKNGTLHINYAIKRDNLKNVGNAFFFCFFLKKKKYSQ